MLLIFLASEYGMACENNRCKSLSVTLFFSQVTRRSEFQWTSLGVSQLKLIYAYYNLEHSAVLTGSEMLDQSALHEEFQGQQLLKPEFILSTKNRLKNVFDKWLHGKNMLI